MRFRAIAAGFVVIGLYHAAAFAIPDFGRMTYPATYPPMRHLIFIALDMAAACLFLVRPPWLIWVFAAVSAVATYNHGAHWRQTLAQNNKVDWWDILIVVFLLASLGTLYSDRRTRVKK